MPKLIEYMPHPVRFGVLHNKNREKIARIEGFERVGRKDEKEAKTTIEKAQAIVEGLSKFNPNIVIDRDDIERFHVKDGRLLYNKPTDRLVNESPHHVRHSVAVLVHSTFFGNFANGFLPGDKKLNILALQLASMTHDGFRSQFDVTATTVNYQLHGILADENFDATIKKTGLPIPDEVARAKAKETVRYHDVDTRQLEKRSPEVEFFNMMDKFELVRLFHTQDMPKLPYRIPVLREGMKFLARRRLHMHEGKTGLFLDIHRSYLVVAEALYQLSMQNMREQYQSQEGVRDWNKVDQFEAVMRAGETLHMIRPRQEQSAVHTPLEATQRA